MHIPKYNSQVIFCFLTLLCFTLDLSAPIVFYGNLFVAIPLLVIYRFIVFPKVSVKKLTFLIILVLLWESLIYIQSFHSLYSKLIPNSQRSVLLFVSSLLIADLLKNFKLKNILSGLNLYIFVLSLFVIYQVIGFYVLHISASQLDPALWLGGTPSRNQYMDGLYRPNGFMAEPAAFVGAQLALLTLQYLMYKKNNLYRILGLISILTSMSFAGFLLAGLWGLIVYLKNLKSSIFLLIASYIAIIALKDIFLTRFEVLGGESDASNQTKIDGLNYFFSDSYNLIFGVGNVVSDGNTPIFFEGITDTTFFLATFVVFGIIFGSFIIFLFFKWLIKSNYNSREKILILLPLLKLTNPALIFFSAYIIFIMLIDRSRSK